MSFGKVMQRNSVLQKLNLQLMTRPEKRPTAEKISAVHYKLK